MMKNKLILTLFAGLLFCTASVSFGQVEPCNTFDVYQGENHLGTIQSFDFPNVSVANLYRYNQGSTTSYYGDEYNDGMPEPIEDTSQVFFVNSSQGLFLFVVHDAREDGDGGKANMLINLDGTDGTHSFNKIDGEGGDGFGSSGNSYTSQNNWWECCTDGFVIGPINDDAECGYAINLAFTLIEQWNQDQSARGDAINAWQATSSDDSGTVVGLDLDQELTLASACCEPVEVEECDTFNVNGTQVGVFDFTETGLTASQLYNYQSSNSSYNGDSLEIGMPEPISNTSQLFLVKAINGLFLFALHDQQNDGGGGIAIATVDIDGANEANIIGIDGEASDNFYSTDTNNFTAFNQWLVCCTDGYLVGPLKDDGECGFSLSVITEFEANNNGIIENWQFTHPGGAVALTIGEEVDISSACCNQPPVAVCAEPIYVELGEDCTATIDVSNIDAGSYDPDGDNIELSIDVNQFNSAGTYYVTLTVIDEYGLESECTATVIVEDNNLPELTLAAEPSILWPPNHKMVPITIVENVIDCSDIIACNIVDVEDSVTSNQPENDKGDGNTDVDWEIVDGVLYLRAERAGLLEDRIYTITVQCEDESGNISESTVEVVVPHDQGKSKGNDNDNNQNPIKDNDNGKGKGKNENPSKEKSENKNEKNEDKENNNGQSGKPGNSNGKGKK